MMDRVIRNMIAAVGAIGLMAGAGVTASAKSLRDVVQMTVDTHPEIGAIRSNRRAIDQELRQARGAYLPSVDLRGAVGHEWSNNPATRGRVGRHNGENGWVDMNRYEAGVSIRQLVFDGLGRSREIERQEGRAQSAQYRVVDTLQAVGLRAVESYLEVQRTRRVVEIAVNNVRMHEGILERVVARQQGGRGTAADVDQARARVSAARAALAQARGRFEDAVAAYIATVGESPEGLDEVTAPEDQLPSNVDEAVAQGIDIAPSIKAAAADVRSGIAAVGVATANFSPRIDLEISANYLHNVDGTRGPNQDLSVMLVGRWNIFRGGIDIARRREAIARLFEARDVLDRAKREVEQQIRISWNALNQARERRVNVREQLEANLRVRMAYSRQFDSGRRTLLDLLDIQNEIFVNRTTLVTEEFTVKFGVYRTMASMGQLLQNLGIEMPGEATNAPPGNFFQDVRNDLNTSRRYRRRTDPGSGTSSSRTDGVMTESSENDAAARQEAN